MDILEGLHEIADNYDVFLLDVWGVLHDGVALYPDTVSTLEQLQKTGKTVCLLSNSPQRAKNLYHQLEIQFHLNPNLYNNAFSSGEAANNILRNKTGKFRVFYNDDFGNSLFDDLALDFCDHAAQADFIINAFHSDTDNYDAPLCDELQQAAEKNIPMLCINPDMIVNIGTSITFCPGTLAARYEEWGGAVTYYGKPHLPFYEQAWDMLGKPDKSRIIAIGDALHTDIQGANNFEIDSLFNLSGIHRTEVLCDQTPEIDHEKLDTLIEQSPYTPTAVLNGFKW